MKLADVYDIYDAYFQMATFQADSEMIASQ